jgi:hypothetical protein
MTDQLRERSNLWRGLEVKTFRRHCFGSLDEVARNARLHCLCDRAASEGEST